MIKIRRSGDRLIFNMGITIPGKDGALGSSVTTRDPVDLPGAILLVSQYISGGCD